MKKKIVLAVLAALAVTVFTGCGQINIADYDSDAVIIKGETITGINVSEFEKQYYDETELSEYIEKAVEEFDSTNGESAIKVEDLAVEEGKAKVKLVYSDATDYAGFNNVDFFMGSVLDARTAGFELPTDIVKTEFATDEMNETSDKAVVIGQGLEVEIDGTITYTSSNVTVKDRNHATVDFNLLDTEAEPGYIIYK